MTTKHWLAFLLPLLFAAALPAQSAERRAGELLVQLQADAVPNNILSRLSRIAGTAVVLKETVAPDWRIYLLGFDESAAASDALLRAARAMPDIRAAQWNYRAPDRGTEPNDQYWYQQDDLRLIGLPDAWDVATGGVTPGGDTIVVAVLEKGALLEHPDIAPNVWYNRHEVPGNNVDDDGNGFKDDYRGWNPRTKNDDPGTIGFHGTAVNGIIGARGNNNIGVSGISWNVKLMPLANIEYESEIIAGYNYVAKMRHLYNSTQGAKGAFVVATNASFGIDYELAEDHPLWCAVYDSLGAVGVVSVGATSNQDINVDEQGDMPSTCPSQYLIAVNNIDKFDKKATKTGYGQISIDLGAPGQGTYTTRSQDQTPLYGLFDGTSAATPHVTGAVGLLYSLNCTTLSADALTNPAACAKRIRNLILDNVSPNTTLAGITSTGGRLDVANAIKAVQNLCNGAPTGPLSIQWLRPNPVHSELRVLFQTPAYVPYQIRIYNAIGQLMHEEKFEPDPFSSNIWKFDASTLPNGVYTVAFGRNDAVRAEKFVKN